MMKEPAVPTKHRRRKYDPAFKAEAVALWQKSGKSAEEIAAELGIREKQLYVWKASSVIPAGPQADLQAENAALRRENELLRQQRDILLAVIRTNKLISSPDEFVFGSRTADSIGRCRAGEIFCHQARSNATFAVRTDDCRAN